MMLVFCTTAPVFLFVLFKQALLNKKINRKYFFLIQIQMDNTEQRWATEHCMFVDTLLLFTKADLHWQFLCQQIWKNNPWLDISRS